ncbi:hypothetical protein IL306_013801 [Fusarium sp. DS 682]|nr:hypothetical protein IL306_013801 [Fusarium sp. DS 682]
MYPYERSEIYQFLREVASKPENYGVSAPSRELQIIYHRIRLLRYGNIINTKAMRLSVTVSSTDERSVSLPESDITESELDNSDVEPRQHIFRKMNKEWDANDAIKAVNSKFHTPPDWTHQAVEGSPLLTYWSPFDLLGLFLSKIAKGNVQSQAEKKNFYLPLTAMYARWCCVIGTNKAPRGVGDPGMYSQCTWNPNTHELFLGVTLSGYEWGDEAVVGKWKYGHPAAEEFTRTDFRKGLQWSRYQLLRNNFPDFNTQWSFMWSPVINGKPENHDRNRPADSDPVGQKFGNCAETYPFIEMLRLVTNSSYFTSFPPSHLLHTV